MAELRCLLSVFLIVLGCVPVVGQPKSDIHAKAEIDGTSVALSGHLTLTFTVEGPQGLEVEKIKSVSPSPVWQVKRLTGPESTLLSGKRVRWRQSFRLEPLSAGKVTLPLSPLRYRLDNGKTWIEHPWKDQTIEVTTEVIEPKVEGLRGNSQIEEVPFVPGWPIWPFLAGAIMLVGSLGFVAWRRRRRQDRPTVSLPPHQWALLELEQLDRQGLPQAGQVERYHTLLSDVLRRFVELRLGLPATQQTTAEFLAAARQSPHLSAESQELLRDFLQRCDLAKFARAEFGPDECRNAARLARDFITRMQKP